jgi:hypothetical protein
MLLTGLGVIEIPLVAGLAYLCDCENNLMSRLLSCFEEQTVRALSCFV